MKLSIVLSTHTAQFQAVAFKGDFESNVAKIAGWGYDGVELAIRDPELVDADELIRDCESMLTTVDGVASFFAGTPFEAEQEGMRRDFDVGFYLGFMSEADYQTYLDHPAHLEIVKKWRPRLQRLRVYDVVDEAP